MFERVLIANRGEIACRIARTLRRLGIGSVAVYTAADRTAAHVAACDAAIALDGSYLDAAAIVQAAQRGGATAVHPGYGFLSENADFAQACLDAGLAFIGPPPSAIRAMGLKSAAKRLMAEAGLPLVPGYHGDAQDPDTLREAAAGIGYPLLIKASAGGGGRGMRVVEDAAGLEAAIDAARREAAAAFGDPAILLERYLLQPRHVEVQVFADRHGHCVHLFERDCSVQRRHQKVLEEAPAPGMSPARRRQMGSAAVAAARAVGYENAGTVEFIVDAAGEFYFMEMNTRLQVEHPVTELVTGLDLVEWQLRVAAGEALPLAQEAITLHGHAIEARLCAEDPARDFAPAPGILTHLRLPVAEGVRVDAGVREGDTVSLHYDSLLAKVVAWGADRDQALARLRRALEAVEVAGVASNRDFLCAILGHAAFAGAGQDPARLDTGLIARHRQALLAPGAPQQDLLLLAAAARLGHLRGTGGAPGGAWALADGWRLNAPGAIRLSFHHGTRPLELTVHAAGGHWVVAGADWQQPLRVLTHQGTALCLDCDGRLLRGSVATDGTRLSVFCGAGSVVLQTDAADEDADDAAPGSLSAPMPGAVVAVLVQPGQAVAAGQPLVVLEAMKMQHAVLAPAAGTVRRLQCAVGDQVAEGTQVVDFEPGESA